MTIRKLCSLNARTLQALMHALAVFVLGIAVVGCSRNARVVREADTLMHQAFLEYAQGSFESASNSLQRFAVYLDANEQCIASYRDYDAVDLNGKEVPFPVSRDIPVTQFAPHSMLACMMIYSGNTNEALRHLSRAYQYHVQIWTRSQKSPVSRSDFVQFILDGREKIDAKTGAAWKTRFQLDTNTVSGIAAAWRRKND
jgi:hypothetical protein